MEQRFPIVIVSAAAPVKLRHLLWRILTDLPDAQIAGIVCETGEQLRVHSQESNGHHHSQSSPSGFGKLFWAVLDPILHWVHCCPKDPNGSEFSAAALEKLCEEHSIPLHRANGFDSDATVEFVRGVRPQIGIALDVGPLKSQLLVVPPRGFLHLECSGLEVLTRELDSRQVTTTEVSVSLRRLRRDAMAGTVLGKRDFWVAPFDTPVSLGLKTELLGIDLLVDALRSECFDYPGTSIVPRNSVPASSFTNRQAHMNSATYKAARGWPTYKLIARSVAYPLLTLRNLRRKRQRRFPVIILFHHLISDRPASLGMPTEQFLKHVRFLKRHYKIASLPEAVEMLKKDDVPMPTVVLTFDDGYAENFLCLRSVIEAEQIPVSLFVCTQTVSERGEFAHDLKRNETGFPALSWEQVRYFDRHNVLIGSHTRTHFDCGTDDQETLVREISGSHQDLRRELGHDVTFFSFPKGLRQNMSALSVQLALHEFPYLLSAMDGENWAPLPEPAYVFYRYPHRDSLWELELLLQSILDFGPRERCPFPSQLPVPSTRTCDPPMAARGTTVPWVK